MSTYIGPLDGIGKLAQGKRCLICGRVMQSAGVSVDCDVGHDILCYSVLDGGEYYTDSEIAAKKCESLGHQVWFDKLWRIRENPNAFHPSSTPAQLPTPTHVAETETQAWVRTILIVLGMALLCLLMYLEEKGIINKR